MSCEANTRYEEWLREAVLDEMEELEIEDVEDNFEYYMQEAEKRILARIESRKISAQEDDL